MSAEEVLSPQDAKIAAELDQANRDLAWELTKAGVDIAGIADPTPLSDLAGAGLSLYEGDLVGAGMSLISALPLGDLVGKAAKVSRNTARIAKLRQKITGLTSQLIKLKSAKQEAKAATRVQQIIKQTSGKADELASTPCIPCKLKAYKQQAANRLAKHEADIKAHGAKYEELAKTSQGRKAGGYKALATEAKGELAATEYMKTNYKGYELASGFEPGTGIDQIWVKRGPDGQISDIVLVEAKGPGQKLAQHAQKGPQMSQKWVDRTLTDWEGDPDVGDLVKDIRKGMQKPPPKVTGEVIGALEDATTKTITPKKLDCPEGADYDWMRK